MFEAIFQFLFKYPSVAYERGQVALASGWPGWVLGVGIALSAAAVGVYLWRMGPKLPRWQGAIVWGLQSLVLAILLTLLWLPTLVLQTVLPQQNVVAVLVDDSASMAMADTGTPRVQQVQETFRPDGPLMTALREKFQVRTYRFSKHVNRLATVNDLTAGGAASRIEDALAEAYSEMRHLPLAGIILASDGAQNGSEAPPDAFEELKARQIPVYTLGVGQAEFPRDLQVDDVAMPRTALPDSLVTTTVTLRQRGYIGQTARLEVREGSSILKTRDIRFGPAPVETVTVNFTPRTEGFREYTVRLVPLNGEAVVENNQQSRLLEVQKRTARILYIEGEPRWEFKFIRRALEEDKNLRLVSMLRTSDNKFYRQGVETPQELADGVPKTKELFQYEAMILGSLQASFFSPAQQESLYAFVSRRGGGMMFLGGRYALSEGGYQTTSLADLLPVQLRGGGDGSSLKRVPAKFRLTPRGFDRLQLSEDEAANRKNWDELPELGNYQVTGEPKSGAVTLAEAIPEDGRRYPVLVSQRFGRGRTYLFATDASWRWRMDADHKNQSHEIFWRQIAHSLLNETPQQVSIAPEKTLYMDEQRVRLTAQIYDEEFQPVNTATAVATIHAPDGSTHEVPVPPSLEEDGAFRVEWEAEAPGVYRVEMTARRGNQELGRANAFFQRADGASEFFSAEQNSALLKRLAEQTGGEYYPIDRAEDLPEQLTYSPAGVSVPEVRDLWDLPAWFLLLFLLKGTEWALRKRWRPI